MRTDRVKAEDEGIRLDRWFKRHFPALGHGRLGKLLRTGQVRVEGGRAKAGLRLVEGQEIRIPPQVQPSGEGENDQERPKPKVRPDDARQLRARVLHRDEMVIALDKPAGLAVQGGTKTPHHLDAMLEALRFGSNQRPRLVHRLDKDTSGVILIARDGPAAAKLTAAFRARTARKIYWAVVAGVPRPAKGMVDRALAKQPGRRGEKVTTQSQGKGKRAVTLYRTIDVAARQAAWLALEPRTGRTHQLRVHCAEMGTPILGDGKYGGSRAFPESGEGAPKLLHLHARAISLPHPAGGLLEVTAPLPDHMRRTWELLGFEEKAEPDPFAGFEE